MSPEEFAGVRRSVLGALSDVSDQDWTKPAFGLEWTCWQTVDHMIDCVFSYAFQLAARVPSGFLPFNELHAQPTATAADLILGLSGVITAFTAIADSAFDGASASDGVVVLSVPDWRSRAAFELALHTYDVVSALGRGFALPTDLARRLIDCPTLWMLDLDRTSSTEDPWVRLLVGSGRPSNAS